MRTFGTLACQQPGCDRTTPGLEGLQWTCPEHSGTPLWPLGDQPCDDVEADCDRSCYQEGDAFVYETTRSTDWGDEDVQAFCPCEHHKVGA